MTLELPPSINALYQNQAYYNKKTRSYVPTGGRILTKKGRELKKVISAQAAIQSKKQGWDIDKLDTDYIYMDTIIYFNKRGRDSDNIYKALQDSLEGIIYKNDSQVLSRTQRVMIDRENPRVEVTFTPVEFKGIFKDKSEANEFVYQCMSCTRYRKGRCSIMNDSLEGIIREEVDFSLDSSTCNEYKQKA